MFFDVDTSRWPQANLTNSPLVGTYLIPVEYCLLAISTVVVSMRLVSRGYFLKCLGLDDYCAIMSWIFATLLIISNMMMVTYGYGRHVYDVDPKQRMYVLFHAWLYQWAATASTGFSKLSVCFFFLRFIPARTARICVHLTILYVITWSSAMAVIWFFRCQSFTSWWTEEVHQPGTCMNTRWFLRLMGVQAAFGASSHFILFILPLSTLWKLDLPRWRKVWLALVLGLGGICCFFAIGRVYYTVLGVRNQDMTWYGYKALLFQALEVESQVIYTCMPFLGPAAQAVYNPVILGLRKLSGAGLPPVVVPLNDSLEFISIDAARISQTAGNFILPQLPQRTLSPSVADAPTPHPSPSFGQMPRIQSLDAYLPPPYEALAPRQLCDVERRVPFSGLFDVEQPNKDTTDVESQAVPVRLTHVSEGSLRRITIG